MSTSLPVPDPRRWWALFLLCTAQFLVILDTSIVGIALPALQRALGFDAAGLQWIFNAYVVAFGGLLLLGGRLADLFGPRRIFGAGFAVLTAASLVAGVATSAPVLLIARAIQGAGAALIAPAALSMVMALFAARPPELRRALGFWGASAAAGGTAGVFLGGVITEWLSWRWTFLINVPIGVLVLLATPAWLPRGVRQRGRVDLAGAITVTSALALAVYAIVTANEPARGARTGVLLAASGALFVAFGRSNPHARAGSDRSCSGLCQARRNRVKTCPAREARCRVCDHYRSADRARSRCDPPPAPHRYRTETDPQNRA
jgi:MFS family permease